MITGAFEILSLSSSKASKASVERSITWTELSAIPLRRSVSSFPINAKPLIHLQPTPARPKKPLTSVMVLGTGQLRTLATIDGVMPLLTVALSRLTASIPPLHH